MKNIAILITCHNRREQTIKSLTSLFSCYLPINYLLEIFLVDDGSTDGTSEQVNKEFPNVKVIKGSGNLFWNQGMRLAWNTAIQKGDYDFYIWLNDDTMLNENAIDHLLVCYSEVLTNTGKSAIITGACMESKEEQVFSYGGKTDEKNVEPNGSIQQCKYINGNIVLIPQEIFNEIGVLSSDYTHGMGDYDYGLQAHHKGFPCYTTKIYVATCPTNKGIPAWCNPKKSIKERFIAFYSPRGLNVKEYVIFRKKFWPYTWVFFAFKAYFKMFFPMFYSKISQK
tara:strand:- start:1108 stop:1953 length:846 start_codon:yes stop_codon:yes gene_type:complete